MAGSDKKQIEKVKQADTNKISKKQARKVVYDKLAGALAEFSNTVSEKKFRNKLKKASKLFAVDIAKAANKLPKATAPVTDAVPAS